MSKFRTAPLIDRSAVAVYVVFITMGLLSVLANNTPGVIFSMGMLIDDGIRRRRAPSEYRCVLCGKVMTRYCPSNWVASNGDEYHGPCAIKAGLVHP